MPTTNTIRTAPAAAVIDGPDAGELTGLRAQLEEVWDKGTSATPERWEAHRPSTGQCAVTALVVQDRFGGMLVRSVNEGDSHYWNRLPDGTEVDLTRDQFNGWEPTEPVVVRERSYVSGHDATLRRYRWLVARLEARSA